MPCVKYVLEVCRLKFTKLWEIVYSFVIAHFVQKIFALKSVCRRKTTQNKWFWDRVLEERTPEFLTCIFKYDSLPNMLQSLVEICFSVHLTLLDCVHLTLTDHAIIVEICLSVRLSVKRAHHAFWTALVAKFISSEVYCMWPIWLARRNGL